MLKEGNLRFSTLVKDKRTALNLTQRQFAQVLKLGKSGERTIRRWEAGESEPAQTQVVIDAIMRIDPKPPYSQKDKASFDFS